MVAEVYPLRPRLFQMLQTKVGLLKLGKAKLIGSRGLTLGPNNFLSHASQFVSTLCLKYVSRLLITTIRKRTIFIET